MTFGEGGSLLGILIWSMRRFGIISSLKFSRYISTGFLRTRTMSEALRLKVDYGLGKWEGKWKQGKGFTIQFLHICN